MFNECTSCGVAYNVGSLQCEESACKNPTAIVTVSSQRFIQEEIKPKRVRVRTLGDRHPLQSRLNSLVARARLKQFECTVTVEFIAETIVKPCAYCGYTGNNQLDRKDNKIGYTPDNVVPACKRCNTVKSMYLTYDQMIVVAKALGWR